MLRQVDAILQETSEVVAFARRTGTELGFFLTETNRGDYSVRLRRGRRRAIEDIIAGVRDEIRARVPGLRIEFVQILQDMIGEWIAGMNGLFAGSCWLKVTPCRTFALYSRIDGAYERSGRSVRQARGAARPVVFGC